MSGDNVSINPFEPWSSDEQSGDGSVEQRDKMGVLQDAKSRRFQLLQEIRKDGDPLARRVFQLVEIAVQDLHMLQNAGRYNVGHTEDSILMMQSKMLPKISQRIATARTVLRDASPRDVKGCKELERLIRDLEVAMRPIQQYEQRQQAQYEQLRSVATSQMQRAHVLMSNMPEQPNIAYGKRVLSHLKAMEQTQNASVPRYYSEQGAFDATMKNSFEKDMCDLATLFFTRTDTSLSQEQRYWVGWVPGNSGWGHTSLLEKRLRFMGQWEQEAREAAERERIRKAEEDARLAAEKQVEEEAARVRRDLKARREAALEAMEPDRKRAAVELRDIKVADVLAMLERQETISVGYVKAIIDIFGPQAEHIAGFFNAMRMYNMSMGVSLSSGTTREEVLAMRKLFSRLTTLFADDKVTGDAALVREYYTWVGNAARALEPVKRHIVKEQQDMDAFKRKMAAEMEVHAKQREKERARLERLEARLPSHVRYIIEKRYLNIVYTARGISIHTQIGRKEFYSIDYDDIDKGEVTIWTYLRGPRHKLTGLEGNKDELLLQLMIHVIVNLIENDQSLATPFHPGATPKPKHPPADDEKIKRELAGNVRAKSDRYSAEKGAVFMKNQGVYMTKERSPDDIWHISADVRSSPQDLPRNLESVWSIRMAGYEERAEVPADFRYVMFDCNLSGSTGIAALRENMYVGGDMRIRGTVFDLPQGLYVGGALYVGEILEPDRKVGTGIKARSIHVSAENWKPFQDFLVNLATAKPRLSSLIIDDADPVQREWIRTTLEEKNPELRKKLAWKGEHGFAR